MKQTILVLGVYNGPTLYFGFIVLYGYKMIITLNIRCGDEINLEQPILNAKTVRLRLVSFKVGWFNIDESKNNNWVDVVSSDSG